ncbi:hypothetical protein BDV41DRAFT_527764 [Aspergillus transmontanensis]|nr:hypothetical protein BDV41DRAFT_527764 [Aspergillus transmontanensis]
MSRHQIICGAQRPITTPTCCMFGFIRAWHGYVLTVCDPRTQILAADMWFSMFRPDPMSREAGERYP